MENTIKNKLLLESRIMRRVYSVWFLKQILPFVLIESALFIIFLSQIAQNVFVAKVVEGLVKILFSNPIEFVTFFATTFLKTRAIVEISLIGSLGAMFLFARHLFQSIIQFAVLRQETKLQSFALHK